LDGFIGTPGCFIISILSARGDGAIRCGSGKQGYWSAKNLGLPPLDKPPYPPSPGAAINRALQVSTKTVCAVPLLQDS